MVTFGWNYKPFGWNYKPAEKHCWLIFCERKRRIISQMNRAMVTTQQQHTFETYGDPCSSSTTQLQHMLPQDLLLKHANKTLATYV
jgi:hypothetical protein